MGASLLKAIVRRIHSVFLFLVALLFPNADLVAQAELAEGVLPAHPYVGLDIGLGALPSSIVGLCPGYSPEEGGPNAAVYGGFFFGFPLAPFHLESRTYRWSKEISQGCPTLLEVFDSGIHTKYTVLVDRVPKYGSDLRIGYTLPFQPSLVASVGMGWLWGADVPYLSSGLRFRTIGNTRFTVDVAWETYRIPFHLRDEEWDDYQLVGVVRERKGHDWQRGWSVRIGFAKYIR